jgi:hypothetical protein
MNDWEINFIDFWSNLFLRPKKFFKKYYSEEKKWMPFFNIAAVIFGFWYWLDYVERKLDKLMEAWMISGWTEYLIFAILWGALWGVLSYFIWGWFYNMRIKFSKGTKDIDKWRQLNMYSSIPIYTYLIIVTIIEIFIYNDFNDYINNYSENIAITMVVLWLLMMYYWIYVSYSWVTTITDIEKKRWRIWFLILPVLFYTLAVWVVLMIML